MCFSSRAQTLGGATAYNFLHLSGSPMITAAGGINVSYKTNEVSSTANNPALLSPDLHTQLNASFTAFLAGIRAYCVTNAYYLNKIDATLGGHIYFVNYGTIPYTDAAGNEAGSFRPVDYVVQVSAAKKYLDRWTCGLTLKFINSAYQQYHSSAIAADVGILYSDSANQLTIAMLAKNMGGQLKTYTGASEDLPFDLQLGFTKRLARAPFGFSITAQHLHRFNINYNDTLFNNENNFPSANSTFIKLFNHFVLATHVYIGDHLEATVGYNQLRREELSLPAGANGLSGFSVGLQIKFNSLQILYARSTYQKGLSYNQIGVNVKLNQLGGIGR